MILFLAILTVFGSIHCQSDQDWVARPEFANKLPATLEPIFQATTQTSGECFYYCSLKNCSSVAYSLWHRSCKLYRHDQLASPLPKLEADANMNHQMYYKRYFCPPGWESDMKSKTCYYMANQATEAKQRILAYETCERNMMSDMVTFESADQRSRLYSLLQSKYSNVTRWWTGYSMFDSNIWPRPIEELPGYAKRRGTCPGFNVYTPCKIMSLKECASECDRKYRDRCVSLSFNRQTGQCCLKHNRCFNSGTGDSLSSGWWFYDKVHEGRPPASLIGTYCNTNVIRNYVDVSRDQCLQNCRAHPQCVAFSYQKNSRNCFIRSKTCYNKAGWTADGEHYDLRDVNDGACPMGIRYRDVCLIFQNTATTFGSAASMCRQMGGKLISPSEKRKNELAWVVFNQRAGTYWLDWVDDGHEGNWTLLDGSNTFSDPAWQVWQWNSGEPGIAAPENFAASSSSATYTVNSATGVGVRMLDSLSSATRQAICETPVSQSWPQNCKFTTIGREYHGSLAVTKSNVPCKPWTSTSYTGGNMWQRFPDWTTDHSFCRNPDPSIIATGPWCYRSDNNQPEECDVPACAETDWAPTGQTFVDQFRPYAAITFDAALPDKYDWTVENFLTAANPLCSLHMSDFCPYYYQGSCFKFYTINMNYNDAKATCANNGWFLVSLTSRDKQNYVSGIAMSLGKQLIVPNFGYYIGLVGTTPTVWDNGEPFVGQGFWSERSSQPCNLLWTSNDGNWMDWECYYKSWFICEINLG